MTASLYQRGSAGLPGSFIDQVGWSRATGSRRGMRRNRHARTLHHRGQAGTRLEACHSCVITSIAASHTDSQMTQTQLQSSVPADTAVTAADVVIGIPTYNNSGTVAHALRATDSACAVFA